MGHPQRDFLRKFCAKTVEGAKVGRVDERTLFGNQEGIDLIESHSDGKADIKELKATGKSLPLRVNALEIRSEEDIKLNEGYRAIRNRFLETFRRGQQMQVLATSYVFHNAYNRPFNASIDCLSLGALDCRSSLKR